MNFVAVVVLLPCCMLVGILLLGPKVCTCSIQTLFIQDVFKRVFDLIFLWLVHMFDSNKRKVLYSHHCPKCGPNQSYLIQLERIYNSITAMGFLAMFIFQMNNTKR